jgi:capsular exopolysaccharide synthesis family protein
VVVREGKTTPIVEMFRMIRTNLQFMIGGTKSPVILVTSSVGGEGKSFTAINLASSFALFNKKVVLIGLDIRKPILGDYMHIEKNKGVSLYLSDPNYKLNDIIISSGIHSSLKVIPAGPVPPNPAELLMSNRLEELISELKKEFDYIIIDSAPVGVVSDTFLINRVVDLSIYVSRQNYTPKDMIETINDIHNNQRLTNMGLVLNGVEEMAGYGYYSTKTKAHYNK